MGRFIHLYQRREQPCRGALQKHRLTDAFAFFVRRDVEFAGCGFCEVEDLGVEVECCPKGMAMWSSTDFRVSSSTGGGISTSGPMFVSIRDTVFRTNEAAKGASLSVRAATSLRITNTTIDEPVNGNASAVHTIAASVQTCDQNPCGVGSRCSFRDFSTFCEPCRENEIGDGRRCITCQAGTEPNGNQSTCVACDRPNEYSDTGLCQLCLGVVTEDRKFCRDCPSHQAPIPGVGGCRCEGGRYNVMDGPITCHQRGYDREAWSLSNDYSVASELFASAQRGLDDKQVCAPCPSCVDCSVQNDPPRIRAGFAMAPAAIASNALSTAGQDKIIFRCRPEEAETDATDQFVVAALDAGATTIPDDMVQCLGTYNTTMNCSKGHTGVLCGECATGYGRKHGNECELCSEALQPTAIAQLVVALGIAAVFTGSIMIALSYYVEGNVRENAVWEQLSTANEASGGAEVTFSNPLDDLKTTAPAAPADTVKSKPPSESADLGGSAALFMTSKRLLVKLVNTTLQPVKIMISYFQVVTQLGNVLHFEFPDMLDGLMRAFKWLVAGIQGVMATECIPGFGGYYESWVLEVFILPLCLFGGVAAYYLSRRATVGAKAAKASARSEAFFILFLIYPSVTSKLFLLIKCRALSEDLSVLTSDYGQPCENAQHTAYRNLAVVLIVGFAFGVPLLLMGAMIKTRASERAEFSTVEFEVVIQRVARQLKETDLDAVRAAVIDISQGKIYGNLISAFRPGWFMWEGVDMLRASCPDLPAFLLCSSSDCARACTCRETLHNRDAVSREPRVNFSDLRRPLAQLRLFRRARPYPPVPTLRRQHPQSHHGNPSLPHHGARPRAEDGHEQVCH